MSLIYSFFTCSCFFFYIRSITDLTLVTDLHFYVYLHGPYGLLEFGIGVLLLEVDLTIQNYRPTYVVLIFFCDSVCLPILFNDYPMKLTLTGSTTANGS